MPPFWLSLHSDPWHLGRWVVCRTVTTSFVPCCHALSRVDVLTIRFTVRQWRKWSRSNAGGLDSWPGYKELVVVLRIVRLVNLPNLTRWDTNASKGIGNLETKIKAVLRSLIFTGGVSIISILNQWRLLRDWGFQ